MDGMRDRLLQLARNFPGLHLRELARQADTSLNLVQYHIQKLQDEGFLEIALAGGKVRVFPPDLRAEDRTVLAILRDKPRLRITMHLLDGGAMSHGDLVRRVKMGKSTLSFHLRQMEDAGVVHTADEGYGLANEQQVRVLLDRYPPTQDAVGRMAEVWEAVYGKS